MTLSQSYIRTIATLGPFLLSVGCATPRYGARADFVGKEYVSSADVNRSIEKVADDEAAKVRVFLGALPDGFELTAEGIAPAEGSGHRVLARVKTTELDGYNAGDAGYCHISRGAALLLCALPLYTAFLGLLACPCVSGHMSNDLEDVELRKSALIAALQRAARALGANAVVVDSLGSTITLRKETKVVVGTLEMANASGWAIQLASDGALGGLGPSLSLRPSDVR